jgi:hypothetical protein
MNLQKLEYLVGEIPDAPQLLEIVASGQTRYYSHTNESTPNLPEIGVYEMTLSRAEIQAIEGLLGGVTLGTVPDHRGRVRSGERYQRLRVTVAGTIIEKLVGPREPVDAGLRRILDGLEQVVARVRTHPRRVLHMNVGLPAINNTAVLAVPMTLSNAGNETLACVDPVMLGGSGYGWLSIELWSARPSSVNPDLITLHPNRVEVESPMPSNRTISIVQLAPGAAAAFRLLVPLPPMPAGEYSVRVQYAATVDRIQDHEVLRGELFSQTVRLTVP